MLILETIEDGVVSLHPGSLYNGRMGVTVTASPKASVGAFCQLRATVEMDGGVFLVSYRSCQIAAPPPPYVGEDPLTKLAIRARGNVVRLRRSRVSQVTVETDCRNDILSRPIDAAHFEIQTTIPGILFTARRGPYRDLIEAFLNVPDSVDTNPY